MKQTAVEWMVEKLFKPMDNPPIENVSDIIQQAKEMEKQQIIDAHFQGSKNSIVEVSKHININNTLDIIKNIEKGIEEHSDGVKYYNETFKNK